MWSPDSVDPVSQAGAGSSPGAQAATAKVILACLWTRGNHQSTPEQLTALHREGHLEVQMPKMKYHIESPSLKTAPVVKM